MEPNLPYTQFTYLALQLTWQMLLLKSSNLKINKEKQFVKTLQYCTIKKSPFLGIQKKKVTSSDAEDSVCL